MVIPIREWSGRTKALDISFACCYWYPIFRLNEKERETERRKKDESDAFYQSAVIAIDFRPKHRGKYSSLKDKIWIILTYYTIKFSTLFESFENTKMSTLINIIYIESSRLSWILKLFKCFLLLFEFFISLFKIV